MTAIINDNNSMQRNEMMASEEDPLLLPSPDEPHERSASVPYISGIVSGGGDEALPLGEFRSDHPPRSNSDRGRRYRTRGRKLKDIVNKDKSDGNASHHSKLSKLSQHSKQKYAPVRNRYTRRQMALQSKQESVLGILQMQTPGGKSMEGPDLIKNFKPNKKDERSFVYTMLNPLSHKWHANLFKRFIALVIMIDTLIFVLSTDEDNLVDPNQGDGIFYIIEGIVSCIYLIEYIARLITCVESSRFKKYGPFYGRLRYAMTINAVIDALATFPFFLEIILQIPLPTLTYLRVFRLLRMLRTEGYMRAVDAVYRVVYFNREILYVALLVCIMLVLVTAVLLYYLRPRPSEETDDIDPNFNNLVSTMYLSAMMLTGQGGPEGDLPWYTKLVVILTAFFSVAMFAIPASMFTWGFEAEAARCAKVAYEKAKKGNKPDNDSTSTLSGTDRGGSDSDDSRFSADSSGYDTDREYQKLLAGVEDEESETNNDNNPTTVTNTTRTSETIVANNVVVNRSSTNNNNPNGTDDSMLLLDRIVLLESRVDATNQKLDQIIQMLSQQQQQQQ